MRPLNEPLETFRLLFKKDFFEALPFVPGREGFWQDALRYQYLLERRGVYRVGIPDLMITTLALRNDKLIYTRDADFPRMAKYLPLQLYNP